MEDKLEKKEKIYAIIRLSISILVIGILIWASVILLPMVTKLGEESYRIEFQQNIEKQGILGFLSVLGLQIVQIVIAIIPGQPMEIISGMLYGTWGGMALCLIGILLGTAIVYFLVKRIGNDFIQLFFSKEKIEKLKRSKIFKNQKKLELFMFIMFLLPLVPKDIFIYLGGLSPIPAKRFLPLATITRIPGLILTVYAGNQISQGSFFIAAIVMLIFLGIGIAGYYISNRTKRAMEKA